MAKPANKLQRRIADLSPDPNCIASVKRIPALTETQKDWFFKHTLKHKGYATTKTAFCLDCGENFPRELIWGKKATCPHCNTRLHMEFTRKRSDFQYQHVALATVVEEFQVVRNFEIFANYRKGKKASYIISPILDYWIAPNGSYTMVGRLAPSGWSGGWSSDWSFRKVYQNTYSYWGGARYKIYPDKFLPGSKFKKEYRKYGINRNIADALVLTDAIKIIPANPIAETLLKAKQLNLVHVYKDYPDKVKHRWPSIKICLRNGYRIKDTTTWFDYIGMLEDSGKDIRNAKFICPKDLNKEHKKYLEIRKRQEAIKEAARAEVQAALRIKQEAERKAKELWLKRNPYSKRKAPFMHLEFKNKLVTVSFLKSVQAIKEEGEVLEHCVYVRKYQNKDTLLFSATIDGKKIATAEVDYKTAKVLQVRGFDNQVTKWDEMIIKLLKRNMKKICDCAYQKPKKKTRKLALAS